MKVELTWMKVWSTEEREREKNHARKLHEPPVLVLSNMSTRPIVIGDFTIHFSTNVEAFLKLHHPEIIVSHSFLSCTFFIIYSHSCVCTTHSLHLIIFTLFLLFSLCCCCWERRKCSTASMKIKMRHHREQSIRKKKSARLPEQKLHHHTFET